MTLQEMNKTKLFKRVVTGLRASKVTGLYETLTNNTVEVVKQCAKKFDDMYTRVKRYEIGNLDFKNAIQNYDVTKALLLIAENGNIWDETIIDDVKELEKGIQDFDFISKLKSPKGGTISELQEYQSLVYNMLLFKKLHFENKLGNLEVCVKNDVPLDETKLVNLPELVNN